MTWPARGALLLVRGYQLALAPFMGGTCRFEPSCSTYALQAIEQHGTWRGFMLAIRRIARCHPLGRPGFDPVPPRAPRA